MTNCLKCKRVWNSLGAYPDFCNEKCFNDYWNEQLKNIVDRHKLSVSTLANVISDLINTRLVSMNDNY